MASSSDVPLVGDAKVPIVGYGTWQTNDEELETALEAALEAGYRHIDTAYSYQNEAVIGRVIRRWILSGRLKRRDLFVTTKLPFAAMRPESVAKYLRRSLQALQLTYVDLYLLHGPFAFKEVEGQLYPYKDGKIELDLGTNHAAIWKEMERMVRDGLARSIGLSNFNLGQIQRILDGAKVPPANLQVELHLYHQQKELVEFCKTNNIVVTAYSPLGSHGGLAKFFEKRGIDYRIELPDLFKEPLVQEIARKHGKTPAQILLRHIIQKDVVVIPKSTNPKRIQQNISVFDFKLDEEDIGKLDDLDKGEDGRIFDFLFFKGLEEHPEYPFRK